MRRYEANATKRNLLFEVDREQFEELVFAECSYCGSLPREISINKEKIRVNGIDRLDNKIGYVDRNIATACTTCNWMKKTMGKKEFLAHIERISTHQELLNGVE